LKRLVWILILLLLAAGAYGLVQWRNRPPEIPFAKVTRETIVDTLSTNGKVQPVEWAEVRAESSGVIARLMAAKGQVVAAGQALAELDAPEARAALAAAEARITQAQAEIETLSRGGRAAEIAVLEGQWNAAREELRVARKELEQTKRLQAKNAATSYEVTLAEDRIRRADIQIQALDQRRASLVVAADKSAAEARLKDARAAAQLAQQQINLATLRAPLGGVLYQFDLRKGGFLNRGDLAGAVGRIDRVKALIYVDEPELGRVAVGKGVTITWDAKPGQQWTGEVNRMPTQIVALGTRQVGEVECLIENPGQDLLPGTNITAAIRAATASSAVAVPKAALRRQDGITGVFLLQGTQVAWRALQLGVSSVTKAQVISGLNEGDAVALPTERPLSTGATVTPVFP
jgi:HlyD family secretion protein